MTGSSALFDGNTTIGGTLTVNGTGEIAGFGLTQNITFKNCAFIVSLIFAPHVLDRCLVDLH